VVKEESGQREQRRKSKLCRGLGPAISVHDFVGSSPNGNCWPKVKAKPTEQNRQVMGTFQCTLNKQTNRGMTDKEELYN